MEASFFSRLSRDASHFSADRHAENLQIVSVVSSMMLVKDVLTASCQLRVLSLSPSFLPSAFPSVCMRKPGSLKFLCTASSFDLRFL